MSNDLLNEREMSDRLNPMLIKDLRQGMRSNVYMVWFIVSQIGLVITCLLPLASLNKGSFEEQEEWRDQNSGYFWLCVASALLFTPMRALFSLGGERKIHALETILITKAGASGVAFGTWCSYMAQNAHFCCSVIPYLLVRYFLGGQEMFNQLAALLTLMIVSGSMTSTAIAISAAPTRGRKLAAVILCGALNLGIVFSSSFLFIFFTFLPLEIAFLLYDLATVPFIVLTMIAFAQNSVRRRN